MSIKPIEVEFLPKDGVTPALGKMEQAAESFGQASEQAASKASARIKSLEADIKSLKAQLHKMQQQSKASSSEGVEELRQELMACRRVIDEQAEALRRLKDRHAQTTSAAKSLVQEQRQLTQTLAMLKVEGRESTQEYARMRQRLAEITDAMGDVRQEAQALAHDDQHLNALTSGLSGLAGAATATTGVLSLFAAENEELVKIQTRLQAVLAITIGLQQTMDAINKSSAFSTVLLAKAKTALTLANTRLATALRITTAQARMLMGTLTLGLSVAISALIAAYIKSSKAASEAKTKREELLELESRSRAEGLKTRLELDELTRKLKSFNGTKSEEKRLVEELNRTRGETFGYYKTLSDWYDAVTAKAEDYVAVLTDEAKMRSLVDKYVEADTEVLRIDKTPKEDYDRLHTLRRWLKPFRSRRPEMQEAWDVGAVNKSAALTAATLKRDELKAQIDSLLTSIAERRKRAHLGDQVDPEEVKREAEQERRKRESERKQTLALVKEHAEAIRQARQAVEDDQAEQMRDTYQREREQMRLEYERRLQDITKWETRQAELIAQLRQRGYKLPAHTEQAARAQADGMRVEAASLYDHRVRESQQQEAKAKAETLKRLLAQHQDYDAQRRQIEADYVEYVRQLSEHRTQDNAQEINAALTHARQEADRKRREVDEAELAASERSSVFLVRLFEDAGEKSIAEIRRIIAETEALIDYLKTTPQGALEARGGLSSALLKLIQSDPTRLKALQDALGQHKSSLRAKSTEDAIAQDWSQGITALKQGGRKGIAQGLEHIAKAATRALDPVKALGESLKGIFGSSQLEDDVSSVADGLTAVVGVASGVGRIMAGEVLGGAQSVLSGIGSIVSMASQAEERHQEALRQAEAARLAYQREYNLLLMRQKLLLQEASSVFGEQDILKAANSLKAYAEAQRSYRESLRQLKSMRLVDGHRKTGLFGWGKGEDVYRSILSLYPKLINAQGELDTAQLKVILSTRKMSEATKAYLQDLVEQGELLDEAKKQFEGYLESTFGSLGSSMTSALVASIREGRDALELFAGDASRIIEQLGERMIYSLHFADRFRALQDELRKAYEAGGSERDIVGRVRSTIKGFMGSMTGVVRDAQRDMRLLKEEAAKEGFDLWGGAQAAQSGRSAAFTTMSQEQGTKLEGLFTAHAEHMASIQEGVEAIMPRLSSILEAIQQVARNTEPIATILEEIRRIKTEGIKVQ